MLKLKQAVMAVITLTLATTASAADKYDWKMQTFWGGGSQPQKVIERFADDMKAASGGALNITVLPNKAVVPHNQSLQAVGSKILQMHFNTPCYSSGIDAAFGMICEMNSSYESPYQFMTWYYKAGGLELARKLYAKQGLYFVGPVPWGAESMPTKDKIASVADFKGVKIRMPEGPSSDLFKAIGAAPVTVPGSEVFTSLEKGVIAATDWGTLSMNEKIGLHKPAPYAIYPGVHSVPVGDVSVNLELWEELPDNLKKTIELGVKSLALDMLETFEAADAEVVANAEAKGITLVKWSAEERAKLRAAAVEVLKGYAEKSPEAGEVYESHLTWMKSLGLM